MVDPSFGFTPGDVIVVTGAASGIGLATALRAAQMGLAVSAWDIDTAGVEAAMAQIRQAGGHGLALTADVTRRADVERAMADTAELGAVRHLVNNAGPASSSALDFDDAVRQCVGSVRLVTQAWLDSCAPTGATLVNIASVAGSVIGSDPDWYPSAKAAIVGYTRHLATHRVDRVRANVVAPGMTNTPRLRDFASSPLGAQIVTRIPLGRMGSADDMAYATLFLLSPLSAYINGVLLPVDGGWTINQ